MKADLAQGDKSAFVLLPQLSGGASKGCGYELGVVSVKTAVTMSAEWQILSLVILEVVIMVVKLVILFDIGKLAANGMGEVVGIVEVFLYLWICV